MGRGGVIFLVIVSMISCSTYKMLPQDMQAEILLQSGVYIELFRKTPQLDIELYALNDFYVEVYFDKITGDLFLRSFNMVKELDLYIPFIGIDSIFKTN